MKLIHFGLYVLLCSSSLGFSSSVFAESLADRLGMPPVNLDKPINTIRENVNLQPPRTPDDCRDRGLCAGSLTAEEAYFPEYARRVSLSAHVAASDVSYDFQSCSNVGDAQTLDELNRVYLRDLGAFGQRLAIRRSGDGQPVACDGDDCYLRVVTRGRGRTVTLAEDGIVECESNPVYAQGGLEGCQVLKLAPRRSAGDRFEVPSAERADDDANAAVSNLEAAVGKQRGYVILADKIRIKGDVKIGHNALVLVARESIDFVDNARLSARWLEASRGREDWSGLEGLDGRHARTQRYGSPEGHFEGVMCLANATPGHPGQDASLSAGALMLISPKVNGSGRLDVRGSRGGDGGTGGALSTWCEGDSRRGTVTPEEGVSGGRGGHGGRGGQVTVYASQMTSKVKVLRTGGKGGAGGDAGYAPNGRGDKGARGAIGERGAYSRVRNFNFGELAYLFAGRGGEADMINVRALARELHSASARGAEHRRTSRELLFKIERDYCSAGPQGSLRTSSRNQAAFNALCDEARYRGEQIERGLNVLSQSEDFLLYVRPDIVGTLRQRVIDSFAAYGQPRQSNTPGGFFWQLVQLEAESELDRALRESDYELQIAGENMVRVEQREAVRIASQRSLEAAQKVVRTLNLIDANSEQIKALRDAIATESQLVGRALKPNECDTWCWVGRIWDVASAIGSAIGDLWNFGDNLWASLQDLDGREVAIASFEDVKKAYEYGKTLYRGEGDQVGIEGLIEKGKEISAGVEALGDANELQLNLARIADASSDIATDVQAQLTSLYLSMERLTGDADVADIAGARARLRSIEAMLKRIQVLNDQIPVLMEEHLSAAAQLVILEMEAGLAELTLTHTKTRLDYIDCRLGRLTGPACNGVPRLEGADLPGKLAVLRDKACVEAMALNERVLLFDYLYHRAKDFVFLRGPGEGNADTVASHDFSRNFMLPEDWFQLTAQPVDAVADFVDALRGSRTGQASAALCDKAAHCETIADNNARSRENRRVYNHTAIEVLRDLGVVDFEVSPMCDDPTAAGAVCHPAMLQPQLKKRVTDFDVRLLTAEGYEMPNGVPWSIEYSHGAVAEFEYAPTQLRRFLFANDYPVAACEMARTIAGGDLGLDFECRDIVHFTDTSVPHDGPTMNDYVLSEARPLQIENYENPDIYGTSVRGRWRVDMRPTLFALNSLDGCYANPVPPVCTPALCSDSRDPSCGVLTQTCAPYFDRYGRMASNPNTACCTAQGTAIIHNTLDEAAQCRGWTSKRCGRPAVCEAICGPRCQALKDALLGFEYVVHWRTRQ